MNRSAIITLIVVSVCIASLGASASTIQSSLSTQPDDVITFEWSQLPIGQDSAKNLKDEMESNKRSNKGRKTQKPQGGQGNKQQSSGGQDSGSGATSQQSEKQGGGMGPGEVRKMIAETSLLDRLMDLLPLLLMTLAALVALALLYRYRSKLWALVLLPVGLVAAILSHRPGSGDREAGASFREYDPQNEVEQAWYTLVQHLNIDDPRSRTPGEIARYATQTGMDREAVEEITEAFQQIRYAGHPVTDGHRKRVRQGMRHLGVGDWS